MCVLTEYLLCSTQYSTGDIRVHAAKAGQDEEQNNQLVIRVNLTFVSTLVFDNLRARTEQYYYHIYSCCTIVTKFSLT